LLRRQHFAPKGDNYKARALSSISRDTGFRVFVTLSESVEEMVANLTARAKDISTYPDHVTHELKSSVTTMVWASELLLEGGLAEPDRYKLLDNISREWQRMNALLER
jgi:signal transduction histidine kinase